MDFDDAGAGLAGIVLIFPACIACPPPAQDTLPELGFCMRGATEIAHELGETVGILHGGIPGFSHRRDLFF